MELTEKIVKQAAGELGMLFVEKTTEMIDAHKQASGNLAVGIRVIWKQAEDEKINASIKLRFKQLEVVSEKSFTFADEPLFEKKESKRE